MQIVTSIADLRACVRAWHARGERVAFVPTMGNLHQGHVSLVQRAREATPHVVVSIFVNPLQFGPNEDFAAYPRTPEADADKLRAAGAELLFLPKEQEIYPHGREGVTQVEVPGLSNELCGAFRPGHFRGVATVVAKLFNMVQPDIAFFGQKDYQQLLVIRRMVADLNLPLEIVGVPTLREADGLAMSSRNGYLNAEERGRAPALYQALRQVAEGLRAGRAVAALEAEAVEYLKGRGFVPEYVSVRSAADLGPPGTDRELVVLGAARLGRTRLIDNLLVSMD
jgi:pantoate--beta-alanine ligase